MFQNFSREVQKLKVRFNELKKREKIFVAHLAKCICKFEELDRYLKLDSNNRTVTSFIKLQGETCKAFQMALEKQSEFEHEQSHLLESYARLISETLSICIDTIISTHE